MSKYYYRYVNEMRRVGKCDSSVDKSESARKVYKDKIDKQKEASDKWMDSYCKGKEGHQGCANFREYQERKQSGVSSGDAYSSRSSSGRNKDNFGNGSASPSINVGRESSELYPGHIIIMKKPLDARNQDHRAAFKHFISDIGIHVYIYSHMGKQQAPYLTIPGEFERCIPYHEILFRDEICFKTMRARGLTYQQIAAGPVPGIGNLIEQSHP